MTYGAPALISLFPPQSIGIPESRGGRFIPRQVRLLLATASPRWLAQIRILTCLVLLAFTLREDLGATAELPASMRVPMGVLRVLYKLPIHFSSFVADPAALRTLQAVTTLLLVAGLLGWRTRLMLPLAAGATLLAGGVWRQYCHFYHTGLLPWYVLAVLVFTPCADAFSLDSLRRRRAADRQGVAASLVRPPAMYGWSLLLCWAAVAIPYTLCGLSKLRSGGMKWWAADNLRGILYVDNLQPMSFKLGWGLQLAQAPDWLLSASAIAVIVVETLFVAVLFSKWARRTLPIAMAGIHLGILLFQHVPFPDLVIFQLVFFNLVGNGKPLPNIRPMCVAPARRFSQLWRVGYPAALTAMTLMFAAVWAGKIEFYPMTAMRMYCGANVSGVVRYLDVVAHHADGRVVAAPMDAAVPALGVGGEARYRDVLKWAFEHRRDRAEACGQFLRYAGGRYNAASATADDIVSLEVREVELDFRKNRPAPGTGTVVRSRMVRVIDPAPQPVLYLEQPVFAGLGQD